MILLFNSYVFFDPTTFAPILSTMVFTICNKHTPFPFITYGNPRLGAIHCTNSCSQYSILSQVSQNISFAMDFVSFLLRRHFSCDAIIVLVLTSCLRCLTTISYSAFFKSCFKCAAVCVQVPASLANHELSSSPQFIWHYAGAEIQANSEYTVLLKSRQRASIYWDTLLKPLGTLCAYVESSTEAVNHATGLDEKFQDCARTF